LRKNPGQHELRRRAALLASELLNVLGNTLIAFKIVSLEPGMIFAVIPATR